MPAGREKTDQVAVADIVRGMRHKDDGVAFFIGQGTQEQHHLAIQTGIESRSWLIEEKNIRFREQFKGD